MKVKACLEIAFVWCANDCSVACNFSTIRDFFNKLTRVGPDFGYYPEAIKSIILAPVHRVENASSFCTEKICHSLSTMARDIWLDS